MSWRADFENAPVDEAPVLLWSPEWDRLDVRQWHDAEERDRCLKNWDYGPTLWHAPPEPPAGEVTA